MKAHPKFHNKQISTQHEVLQLLEIAGRKKFTKQFEHLYYLWTSS